MYNCLVYIAVGVISVWLVNAQDDPLFTMTCVRPSEQGTNTNLQVEVVTAEYDCAVSESDGLVYVRVVEPYVEGGGGGEINPPDIGIPGIPGPLPDYLIETSCVYDTPNDPEVIAKPGTDYGHVSFHDSLTAHWDAPEHVYRFTIPIVQDDIVEGHEFFQVNLFDAFAYGGGFTARKKRNSPLTDYYPLVTQLKILIVDDDACFQFANNVFVTNEYSTKANFQIIRKGRLQNPQHITFRTEDITATGGNDYRTVLDGTLQFTDTVSENMGGSIEIYTDSNIEGPEMLKIVMTSSSEGTTIEDCGPSEAVVIILDSGPFAFDMTHYEVGEGDDFTFRVCRVGDLAAASSVISVQTFDGSAQSSSDYVGFTGPISFAAGEDKSEPITIATIGDTDVEDDESLEIALVANGDKIHTASVRILDDDVRYCFESKSLLVSEGDEYVSLTIVKAGNLQDTTRLTVTTSDGLATSPNDYTSVSNFETVTIGTATRQVNLYIEDDNNWEPTECFNVDLSIGDDVVCSAIISIKDNDVLCDPDCENDGYCYGPNKCLCQRDYTGERCERALCEFECQNGGTCVAPNTCMCTGGFTGENCETELCHQSCEHGICNAFSNECSCRQGFTGERCQTYICSPTCENGGMCADTGSCLCPSGFIGTHCQIAVSVSSGMATSTIEGQLTITSIDGEQAFFSPELNIEGSQAREDMIRRIQPLFNRYIGTIPDVFSIQFRNFRAGSVVVEYTVNMESGTQTTTSTVNNGINTLIQAAPSSGLVIDPNPALTFISARCPDNYCQNGGICTADTYTGYSCSCRRGYTGDQCDEEEASLSGGELAGILFGVCGVIIISVLIGFGVCIYMRRAKTIQPKTQPPPNINTLDLAPYPYTFPRVDAAGIGMVENTLMF